MLFCRTIGFFTSSLTPCYWRTELPGRCRTCNALHRLFEEYVGFFLDCLTPWLVRKSEVVTGLGIAAVTGLFEEYIGFFLVPFNALGFFVPTPDFSDSLESDITGFR